MEKICTKTGFSGKNLHKNRLYWKKFAEFASYLKYNGNFFTTAASGDGAFRVDIEILAGTAFIAIALFVLFIVFGFK